MSMKPVIEILTRINTLFSNYQTQLAALDEAQKKRFQSVFTDRISNMRWQGSTQLASGLIGLVLASKGFEGGMQIGTQAGAITNTLLNNPQQIRLEGQQQFCQQDMQKLQSLEQFLQTQLNQVLQALQAMQSARSQTQGV